jgi:hypothetical protein
LGTGTNFSVCRKDRKELLAREEFIEELSQWGEEKKVPLPGDPDVGTNSLTHYISHASSFSYRQPQRGGSFSLIQFVYASSFPHRHLQRGGSFSLTVHHMGSSFTPLNLSMWISSPRVTSSF